jgi:hypothetical protein
LEKDDSLSIAVKVPGGCFSCLIWVVGALLCGYALHLSKQWYVIGFMVIPWLVANKVSGTEALSYIQAFKEMVATTKSRGTGTLPGTDRTKDEEREKW